MMSITVDPHIMKEQPTITPSKATFSLHKLIQKNAQMTTLYTNCSLYITFTMIFIILDKKIFVNVCHNNLTSG